MKTRHGGAMRGQELTTGRDVGGGRERRGVEGFFSLSVRWHLPLSSPPGMQPS